MSEGGRERGKEGGREGEESLMWCVWLVQNAMTTQLVCAVW